MNDKRAILAVEDKLGEVVLLKILGSLGVEVSQSIGFQGKGYLQNKAQNLNQASLGFPVIMLTDQDLPEQCPPGGMGSGPISILIKQERRWKQAADRVQEPLTPYFEKSAIKMG